MPSLREKDKEAYNAYFREYRKRNRDKIREYNKEYNKEWRKKNGYHNEENWKKNNPIKLKAQYKARLALRYGRIKKERCIVCGDINAVMHHPNYRKPLVIMWLCKIHHRQVHYGGRKKLSPPLSDTT